MKAATTGVNRLTGSDVDDFAKLLVSVLIVLIYPEFA